MSLLEITLLQLKQGLNPLEANIFTVPISIRSHIGTDYHFFTGSHTDPTGVPIDYCLMVKNWPSLQAYLDFGNRWSEILGAEKHTTIKGTFIIGLEEGIEALPFSCVWVFLSVCWLREGKEAQFKEEVKKCVKGKYVVGPCFNEKGQRLEWIVFGEGERMFPIPLSNNINTQSSTLVQTEECIGFQRVRFD